MENRDKLTWRLWEVEGMRRSLLVGGLLFYIPILNLILLGYWGLWLRRLERGRASELPDWRNWRPILRETIQLLPIVGVIVLLPLLVAGLLFWGISGVFGWLSFGWLATSLGLIPLSIVGLLIPPAFVISVMRYHCGEGLSAALDLPEMSRIVLGSFQRTLLPLLQFYGIIFIGWPLLGFAVFLGLVALCGHLMVLLRSAQADLNAGVI